MTEKIQGIILNSIDYKENHKILYILTKEGKVSLLVQRAKRYKEGLTNETQNLTLVEFVAHEGDLLKAKSIEAVDYYEEIKQDIKRMAVASYALELIYRMVHLDTASDLLYSFVVTFFEKLKSTNEIRLLLLEFRIKMLYFLGVQPNFKSCIHCHRADNLVGLSILYGSMECLEHQSEDNIGMDATSIIHLLYLDKTLDIKNVNEEALDYVSKLIDSYYRMHVIYELKGKRMLESLHCY